MADIAAYTRGIVRGSESEAVDESRLGECPRCGRPVIEGNRGYGCSGWKDGCPFVLWKEYKGGRLEPGHARELLQRRALFRPPAFDGSDGVILTLSDAGAVLEVRTPQAEGPRPAKATKPTRTRRTARAKPTDRDAPKVRRPKATADAGADGEKKVKKAADGPLGPCPLCKAVVIEGERGYGCSGWRNGCKFVIWKTIAGKQVSATTARALLKKGVSPPLKGFKSKSGSTFDARLKLENGQVRFEFEA